MNASELPTNCAILHRDERLLVVDKPSGCLSHPNPGSAPQRQRVAFEGSYDPAERRFDSPAGPVWLIHRLDQDTSGVLVAAWDADTAARCREAFERGNVEKHYLALVNGVLAANGTWKDALAEKRAAGKVRVSVRPGAPANAELRFRVVNASRREGLSLLDVHLITGRTHQIRVQAASRHHPVLGDDVYGNFRANRRARQELGLRRIFLHAASLSLPHPVTGRMLTWKAPLPEALVRVLEQLDFPIPGGESSPE